MQYGLESGYGSIQAEREIFNPLLMKRVSNYLCNLKENNIPISITTGMSVEEKGCPFLPRCDMYCSFFLCVLYLLIYFLCHWRVCIQCYCMCSKLVWAPGSDTKALDNIPTIEPQQVFEAKTVAQHRGLYAQRFYKVGEDLPLFFWGEILTKAIAFEVAGGRDKFSEFPGRQLVRTFSYKPFTLTQVWRNCPHHTKNTS